MKAATEKKFVILKTTGFDQKTNIAADHALREMDTVKRWKKVHDLLRKQNKKARKEQDKTAKECAEVRAEKIFKKANSEHMGLRFGVAVPPMTWDTLIAADMVATGESVLASPDKEEHQDLKGTNKIVKDLGRAFPQYKVS